MPICSTQRTDGVTMYCRYSRGKAWIDEGCSNGKGGKGNEIRLGMENVSMRKRGLRRLLLLPQFSSAKSQKTSATPLKNLKLNTRIWQISLLAYRACKPAAPFLSPELSCCFFIHLSLVVAPRPIIAATIRSACQPGTLSPPQDAVIQYGLGPKSQSQKVE